ncbi:histidine-containing phosphotransfer protein 3-like isoform X2 [Lotus japonicus]|uniref:histidine-containing phosphotransfer protein 3-like isoform X2 n=1 Tax=Lotus japonicus TaxID=34305 RepID=UPI002585BC01|nr:histidine-containing phosphotransfer protein 3-like isoform X2 [Lotus japonicus]XP_057453408.1 histidine-containing phosphotransfer protein 3-like isoform X2 [Lotus japonicus]XP_057453409.1 histidine-containing phosphotransfer protein 3-like isoform X2 [Lotus japonicus]
MTMFFLRGYLHAQLIRMFDEGVVNDQFSAITCPRNNRGRARDHAVQLIESYLADVDVILSELSRHVDNSHVDFYMLGSLAREVHDKSTSIGADHMRLACFDVIAACDERCKSSFSHNLTLLKNEFGYTKRQLSNFVQLERDIIRLEESSQPPN